MMFFFLWALLTVSPSIAATPPTTSAAPKDALAYNDAIVQIGNQYTIRFLNRVKDQPIPDDPEQAKAWLDASIAQYQRGLAALQAIPTRPGDPGLKQALEHAFEYVIEMLQTAIPQIWDYMHRPVVHNADLLALDQLYVKIDTDSNAIDAEIQKMQKQYGEVHHLLIGRPPDLPEIIVPVFTAPNIPPAGLHVSGDTFMSFTVRYHNHLLEYQNQLVDVYNDFLPHAGDPDLKALDQRRQQNLAKLQQIHQQLALEEDWQGDRSLLDGVLKLADTLEGVFDGPFRTAITTALRIKYMDQVAANTYNQTIQSGTNTADNALSELSATLQTFQAHWSFSAYHAWIDQIHATGTPDPSGTPATPPATEPAPQTGPTP